MDKNNLSRDKNNFSMDKNNLSRDKNNFSMDKNNLSIDKNNFSRDKNSRSRDKNNFSSVFFRDTLNLNDNEKNSNTIDPFFVLRR
jgi:hypothetical protein